VAMLAPPLPRACHPRMLRRPLPFVTALALAAAAPAQSPRPLPDLAAATRIVDTKTGEQLDWATLLERLAKFDAVFLGETHVDDTTHRVELAVLEGLLEKRAGKVVLSMEMFERDVQGAVDDYLAGRIDEAAFLHRARPWQNYDTAYRPLVEAAKAAKIPVVAANFPATLRRKLGGDDPKAAIAALPPEQRAWVPAEIFAASDGYWERVDRAVRGHMGGGGGGTAEERLYDTQNLWDNAMGDAVAKARAAHEGSLVLHVAGGFHVAYRDGTAAQFARRAKDATFAVVSIAPTLGVHTARPDRDKDQADFLVYAAPVARDFNEGNFAVSVPAELRYRLVMPEVTPPTGKWPLLVWLPARTTRTEDAVAMWRLAAGKSAAIAVVEAPFPEVQDDLGLGGRYAFGDGFRADYSRVAQGIAGIVEYLTRRLSIDATKVVVAGEGDGGAAVLWTALYGEWLDADFVAIDPSDLTRLSMEGLPDQKPVAKSLLVLARDPANARITKVAADYQKVGTPTTIGNLESAEAARSEIRQRLRLGWEGDRSATVRHQLRLATDTPRAREWQELHRLALMHAGHGASVVEPGQPFADEAAAGRPRPLVVGGDGPWPVASFANGTGLPLAGGPFGGTTVVVLPPGTSDADKAAWLEHEKNKVLKRRSMFANIAIATADADGDLTLPKVLTKLKAMGRSRVLIVPAAFCADGEQMQAMKKALGDAGAGMDVAWSPGLGGDLPPVP